MPALQRAPSSFLSEKSAPAACMNSPGEAGFRAGALSALNLEGLFDIITKLFHCSLQGPEVVNTGGKALFADEVQGYEACSFYCSGLRAIKTAGKYAAPSQAAPDRVWQAVFPFLILTLWRRIRSLWPKTYGYSPRLRALPVQAYKLPAPLVGSQAP